MANTTSSINATIPTMEGFLSLPDNSIHSSSTASSSTISFSPPSNQSWTQRWCVLSNGELNVYASRENQSSSLQVIRLNAFQQLKVAGDYANGEWDLTLCGSSDVSIGTGDQLPPPKIHIAGPCSPSKIDQYGTSFSNSRTLPKSATSGSLSAMFMRLSTSASSSASASSSKSTSKNDHQFASSSSVRSNSPYFEQMINSSNVYASSSPHSVRPESRGSSIASSSFAPSSYGRHLGLGMNLGSNSGGGGGSSSIGGGGGRSRRSSSSNGGSPYLQQQQDSSAFNNHPIGSGSGNGAGGGTSGSEKLKWSKFSSKSKKLYKFVASGLPMSSSNLASELQAEKEYQHQPHSPLSPVSPTNFWTSRSPSIVQQQQQYEEKTKLLTLRAPDAKSMVRWAEVISQCLYGQEHAYNANHANNKDTVTVREMNYLSSPSRTKRTPLSEVNNAFAENYKVDSDHTHPIKNAEKNNMVIGQTQQKGEQKETKHYSTSSATVDSLAKRRRRASLELFSKLSLKWKEKEEKFGSSDSEFLSPPTTTESADLLKTGSSNNSSSSSADMHTANSTMMDLSCCHDYAVPASAQSSYEAVEPERTNLSSFYYPNNRPSTAATSTRPTHRSRRSSSYGSLIASLTSSSILGLDSSNSNSYKSTLPHSSDQAIEPNTWTNSSTNSSRLSPGPCTPSNLVGEGAPLGHHNERSGGLADEMTLQNKQAEMGQRNAGHLNTAMFTNLRQSEESNSSQTSSRAPLGLGLELGGRRRLSNGSSSNNQIYRITSKGTESGALSSNSTRFLGNSTANGPYTIVESPSNEEGLDYTEVGSRLPSSFSLQKQASSSTIEKDFSSGFSTSRNRSRESTTSPEIDIQYHQEEGDLSYHSQKHFLNPVRTSLKRLAPSPSMPSLKVDMPRLQQPSTGNFSPLSPSHSSTSPLSKLQGARQMLVSSAKRKAAAAVRSSQRPEEGSEILSLQMTQERRKAFMHDDDHTIRRAKSSTDGLYKSPKNAFESASPNEFSSGQYQHRASSPSESRVSTSTNTTIASPPTVERILPPEEIIATIDRLRSERVDQSQALDLAGVHEDAYMASSPRNDQNKLKPIKSAAQQLKKQNRPNTSPALSGGETNAIPAALDSGRKTPTSPLTYIDTIVAHSPRHQKNFDQQISPRLRQDHLSMSESPSTVLRSLPVPPRRSKPFLIDSAQQQHGKGDSNSLPSPSPEKSKLKVEETLSSLPASASDLILNSSRENVQEVSNSPMNHKVSRKKSKDRKLFNGEMDDQTMSRTNMQKLSSNLDNLQLHDKENLAFKSITPKTSNQSIKIRNGGAGGGGSVSFQMKSEKELFRKSISESFSKSLLIHQEQLQQQQQQQQQDQQSQTQIQLV